VLSAHPPRLVLADGPYIGARQRHGRRHFVAGVNLPRKLSPETTQPSLPEAAYARARVTFSLVRAALRPAGVASGRQPPDPGVPRGLAGHREPSRAF
jgi:hypothetical protein